MGYRVIFTNTATLSRVSKDIKVSKGEDPYDAISKLQTELEKEHNASFLVTSVIEEVKVDG